MKIALTSILIGWALVGTLSADRAEAQPYRLARTANQPATAPQPDAQPAPAAASAATAPAGQPGSAGNAPGVPGNGLSAAEGAPSNDDSLAPENGMLMDNGLWDGAPMGPCCAICGDGSSCPPDWYVEEGVRILGRSRPRGIVCGYDFIEGRFANPSLTTRSPGPNISAAWYTTVGHYFARDPLNNDHFVEFSFWGLNGWRDQATLNGHELTDTFSESPLTLKYGSLFSPFTSNVDNNGPTTPSVTGFTRADTMTAYYSSYTNNFEINGRFQPRKRPDRLVLNSDGRWRRECQPGKSISYLYGLRYMQVNETFRLHSEAKTFTFLGDTLLDTQTYTGDYDISARNNLLGLQVGAEMLFRDCRWTWGVRSKVGPYLNFSDQESIIQSGNVAGPAPGDFNQRMAASAHKASLIGEVGFEATFKFRPNLMGRAAYDMMWVSGLAMAPEQLQFDTNPVNKINTNGTIFFHGVSLGLESTW